MWSRAWGRVTAVMIPVMLNVVTTILTTVVTNVTMMRMNEVRIIFRRKCPMRYDKWNISRNYIKYIELKFSRLLRNLNLGDTIIKIVETFSILRKSDFKFGKIHYVKKSTVKNSRKNQIPQGATNTVVPVKKSQGCACTPKIINITISK